MKKIGFIGAGQMATALASGIAGSNHGPFQFEIADPSDEACQRFQQAVGAQTKVVRGSNQDAANCEWLFVAVKPQYLETALADVVAPQSTVAISIVAGVPIIVLERLLKTEKIIRVMPNTPCLIGKGACGLAAGPGVTAEESEMARQLMATTGICVDVDEELIDSVTGVSGSGPAYVFTFIEALIDGGVMMGLARPIARKLALQTVLGAASMVEQSNEHPAVLRDRVTSPGGTTIAAVKALEETNFRDSVMSAVVAATERARELGS